MRVTTGRGEEFDLTTCEVCGMWWTAAKREQCPRCAAADKEARLDQITRRADQIMHELEMRT